MVKLCSVTQWDGLSFQVWFFTFIRLFSNTLTDTSSRKKIRLLFSVGHGGLLRSPLLEAFNESNQSISYNSNIDILATKLLCPHLSLRATTLLTIGLRSYAHWYCNGYQLMFDADTVPEKHRGTASLFLFCSLSYFSSVSFLCVCQLSYLQYYFFSFFCLYSC